MAKANSAFEQCFLSIPGLIYLVMVPMWSRAWRFANVYAYAAIDILFTVLWLAAFSAVATWNKKGIEKGDNDSDEDSDSDSKSGTCASFAYGSASRCKVSKATVGFGVIICLAFVITSLISVYNVKKYRRDGVMPNGIGKGQKGEQLAQEDPNKDPWSTNMHEADDAEDETAYRRPSNPFGDHNNISSNTVQNYGRVSQQDEDTSYGLLNVSNIGSSHHGNLSHSGSGESLQSGSQSGYGPSIVKMPEGPPEYDDRMAPSALSPTGAYQEGLNDRLSFPEGNYRADFR